MSATGRKPGTCEIGFYPTPPAVVWCALQWALEYDPAILEAGTHLAEGHVGTGNWVEGIHRLGLGHTMEVMDLDPFAPGLDLARRYGWTVTDCDRSDLIDSGFLRTPLQRRPRTVLGNPPFSIRDTDEKKRGDPVILRHVERAIEQTERFVLYVLPVGFLGSKERQAFFDGPTPSHLRAMRVICPRARYRNKSTDSADAGVFLFDRCYDGRTWDGGQLYREVESDDEWPG